MSDPIVEKVKKINQDVKPDQVAMKAKKLDAQGALVDRPAVGTVKDDKSLLTQAEIGGPDAQAEQFPTDGLNARDPKDAEMELKYRLQQKRTVDPNNNTVTFGEDTGVTPYGELTWDDKYVAYLLKKQEAERKAEFQQWFAIKYDKMSPAQKAVARELYPSFYAERKKMLQENLQNMAKLAEIKIEGVKDKDDLALQYAADRGLLPMDMYRNVLFPELVNANPPRQFKRGLFNTNRYFMEQRGADAALQANQAAGYQRTVPSFMVDHTIQNSEAGIIARGLTE